MNDLQMNDSIGESSLEISSSYLVAFEFVQQNQDDRRCNDKTHEDECIRQ